MLALALALLVLPSCTSQYVKRVEDMQDRVDDLLLLCNQINENISSISTLVKVIESRDMITGLTEIRSDNVVTGYRINFVNHEPVTIYNGLDGKIPLIASTQDPSDKNYYWTVQYGNQSQQWLLDSYGNRMLSIGKIPYVTITDGKWYFSEDGRNFIELGSATGENGDQMFSSINTFNPAYVEITLSNGQVFRIPTNDAYQNLRSIIAPLNENTSAQVEIIKAALDKLVSIKEVKPVLSGKDTVGMTVTLSNGKSFTIHDWAADMTPVIFVKQYTDGKLYWAYTIGGGSETWVLSPSGDMIPAASDEVEVPLVSVEAGDDGYFYWAMTLGGTTQLLRQKVGSDWRPRAIDSVKSAFSDVRDYSDSLVVVLKGGQRYVLPKQYSIWMTDAKGKPIGDSIVMKEVAGGDKAEIRYTVNGPAYTLSLIVQGSFAVTRTDGGFTITAPQQFASGEGKVAAVFSFESGLNPVTVVKTITVTK